MSDLPTPTFDDWVHFCFTNGDYRDEDGPDREPYEWLDAHVLARYIIKLFEQPEFVADRYSDDQISIGVWFIFGIPGYFRELRSEQLDMATQVACMRSVEPFYLRLLDRVCCRRGADPEGCYADTARIDGAVYMIWDMDCIASGVIFHEDWPHLVDPGLNVLENVLMKCTTSTCMHSALHGLGHIHMYHPQECERIIDRFLNNRQAPQWIQEYAHQARLGSVM